MQALELVDVELELQQRLTACYGSRTPRVLDALGSMGPRYYFRTNSLASPQQLILDEMGSELGKVRPHEQVADAAWIPTRKNTLWPHGARVEADKFAAEAVLQGAHLYARGVRKCAGLKAGMPTTVVDEKGHPAGVGLARQGETAILTHRQGLAVEVQESRFGLPSLMETDWFQKGQIHLQSLPAMVACRVLDPQPGEVIIDLNCSPGGKMSYLCQLAGNQAELVGFDRNSRKIEKTRQQLERLHCQNYRLAVHDSRYVHIDYSLRGDRVLVDPPCTGLGVTPKLFVDTTCGDVDNLASYQKQFLTAASQLVKQGGVVVYSVCTITREECEDVARFGTDNLGLVLEKAVPMIGNPGMDPEGLTQRFDPDLHWSGFFIARFRKP